jgi:hypothetical protein
MPVPTYLLKTTVEFWMHTETARATLIFADICFPRRNHDLSLKVAKLFRK